MDGPLTDLIIRLEAVVNDPNQRPLLLHWSDVELLRNVRHELELSQIRLNATRNALHRAMVFVGNTPL